MNPNVKLLKAPNPDEPWVALHRVQFHKWHWVYYHGDGTESHDIGPIETTEMLIEVRKPEPKNT